MDCTKGIISDGNWNFVGCAEEISTICWRNDQTPLSARGFAGEYGYINSWKMPKFLSGSILGLHGECISILDKLLKVTLWV